LGGPVRRIGRQSGSRPALAARPSLPVRRARSAAARLPRRPGRHRRPGRPRPVLSSPGLARRFPTLSERATRRQPRQPRGRGAGRARLPPWRSRESREARTVLARLRERCGARATSGRRAAGRAARPRGLPAAGASCAVPACSALPAAIAAFGNENRCDDKAMQRGGDSTWNRSLKVVTGSCKIVNVIGGKRNSPRASESVKATWP
jgi:hypothetical protein